VKTVRWAEITGLVAVLLGTLREVLIWDQRVALDGTVLAFVFTAGVPLLMAVLVLLATRRGSKAAFAALVIFTGLAWLTTWKLGLTDGSVAFSAGAASLILQSISLLLLVVAWVQGWRGQKRA
jgi:hypothetical protein